MSIESLSANDKVKLNEFVDEGMKVMQEVQDLRDGLKDVTKNLAEEFNVKPAILSKFLRAAWKANFQEEKDNLDTVEHLLQATGRG